MAVVDPTDTLAFHNSRILCTYRDMSHIPMAQVSKKIVAFMAADTKKSTSPDSEAVNFYAMNHGMALLMQHYEPMERLAVSDLKFVEKYHETMTASAIRAFYYLLVICNREARHNQSWTSDIPKISAKFGPAVANYFAKAGGGEGGIHQSMLHSPPTFTVGEYCAVLQWMFYNSKWHGGFGGKAWGAVTDCLCRFVTGEFSAEMMLDTNWTLAHNNGPIFNKGHMYSMYSGTLARILDVQRSGQVPEAVLTDNEIGKYASKEMKTLMAWLYSRFPGKIGKYVDWFAVEALGSVKKYPTEQSAQLAQHGPSPMGGEIEKKIKAQAEAKKQANIAKIMADEKQKAKFLEDNFEVMPGLTVPKIKLKRAA